MTVPSAYTHTHRGMHPVISLCHLKTTFLQNDYTLCLVLAILQVPDTFQFPTYTWWGGKKRNGRASTKGPPAFPLPLPKDRNENLLQVINKLHD